MRRPCERTAPSTCRHRLDSVRAPFRPRGEKFFREVGVQAKGDFRQKCLLWLVTNATLHDGAARYVQGQQGERRRQVMGLRGDWAKANDGTVCHGRASESDVPFCDERARAAAEGAAIP